MSKADKVQEHDKSHLHKMGYAQQLARRMSGFSNFAISFSIICILAGGITAFPLGFRSTGGAGVGIGWLVGGIVAIIVSLSMGQIASAYPTAGGLYHWASMLGGRGWGWITAWFNVLGLFFVVSSVDVGVWLLFRDLILVGIFNMDPASFTAGNQLVAVALILISHGLFNHYGIELTTKLTDFSGYFIFIVAVILTIALLAFSPVPLDFSRLFTFTNVTGAAGGDVIPRTESLGFAFLFGLILVCYTITGYDASAHTSEETRDAQVNVPKGMYQAVFWSLWHLCYLYIPVFISPSKPHHARYMPGLLNGRLTLPLRSTATRPPEPPISPSSRTTAPAASLSDCPAQRIRASTS